EPRPTLRRTRFLFAKPLALCPNPPSHQVREGSLIALWRCSSFKYMGRQYPPEWLGPYGRTVLIPNGNPTRSVVGVAAVMPWIMQAGLSAELIVIRFYI